MGFENLNTALDVGAALAPLTKEQIAFDDEKLKDVDALGIVLNDAALAERWVGAKARPQEWNRIDDLYRGEVRAANWSGSNEARSHLSMPVILEVVESMLPQIFLAFFSDKRPFILSPKGVTTENTALAASKVLEWCVKQSNFKEEIRKILKSCLLYGTGIGKWGWSVTTEKRKTYTREEGKIVSTTEEYTRSVPTFEYCELGNILVDSALRSHDIRDAKFVIQQKFITANDLDDLRDDEAYKNVPTREELKEILAAQAEPTEDTMSASKVETYRTLQAEGQTATTSIDPLMQPLELLEYRTADRVIVVLQRKIILRNDENEWDKINFVSCAFIDVLKAFYGLGIATLLEGEQKLEAGVANAWIDSLSLTLSPAFHRKKGVGPSAQNIKISPGRVINDDGELAPLAVQSVTAEALQALQNSESRARRRVGANFGPDMPNQAMRTAEGVQEFTAGIQIRTQYFVELFADFVFVPTLEAFVGLAKDNLAPEDIDNILTESEGKAFNDDHLSIYKGNYALEVLSSTKLAAKRAMVSLIPTLMQLFSAGAMQEALVVQNKKIDFMTLLNEVIDLTGYDALELVVDMTPDDQARAMQQNPAAIKAMADAKLQQQKHSDDMELEQSKGDVRGGLQVVKHVLSESGKHDEIKRGMLQHMLTPPQSQSATPLAEAPPANPVQNG